MPLSRIKEKVEFGSWGYNEFRVAVLFVDLSTSRPVDESTKHRTSESASGEPQSLWGMVP